MDKLFLLDAYALIYRSYYAFIKNPRVNSKGLNTSAIIGFVNTLQEVLEKEQPQYIGVAFDPHGPTFRSEAYPAYKAQRDATPEDIKKSVPIIKQLLEAYRIPVLQADGFEADDVIGTLAKKADSIEGLETYMLTPDKDYGQLVTERVKVYRPRHGGGYEVLGPNEVCEKYGITTPPQIIDLLALMGDSADNFPGCPGVGEKTAAKLINQFQSVEQMLNNIDQLKGALKTKVSEHTDDIRMSYFLATIKTDVPVELDLEKLKLSTPNEKELAELFTELEFKSLMNRVLKKDKVSSKKVKSEPSLFDEFTANDEGEPEFSSFETIKTTPHKYLLVEDERFMTEMCDLFRTKGFFSLDTETTSLSAIDAELVGLSFAVNEHEAFYVPIPSDREKALHIVNIFKSVYEDPKILKIGQNLKYDLQVLRNYNICLEGPMWDTMIAHYLIQPELRHNMDYMAEVYLGYQTIHIDQLIGPKDKSQQSMRNLTPEQVYEYACEDADITLQLKNKLEPELKKAECEDLFYQIEMPLMPVLADMEMEGVRLDTESLKETSTIMTERMQEIENRIYDLAGEKFNIGSPKQVGEILFDKLKITDKAKKTKKGQYVTSEETLQQLRNKNEIVEKILEYRGLKKLVSSYIDALPKLVNPHTNHIHTSFNQTITSTGRLSSSDPNLQNIPIRGEDGKEIRKAFIPEEGCLFFSADYSQIELRVIAHLSEDENMINVFQEGKDLHAATAANIYKKPIEKVTRDERSKSKRANFGIIYGITPFGLAERLDIPREEAKMLIDGYFATFPQVKKYMDDAVSVVREKGYATTLFGRRRYLPDIQSMNKTVRNYAERNAINAPIQGTAADIIKLAMIRIWQRFKAENIRSKMILQVHDELNFSVYPDEKEKVEKIVIEEMQNVVIMKVPLTAESGWGKNWLEAH